MHQHLNNMLPFGAIFNRPSPSSKSHQPPRIRDRNWEWNSIGEEWLCIAFLRTSETIVAWLKFLRYGFGGETRLMSRIALHPPTEKMQCPLVGCRINDLRQGSLPLTPLSLGRPL